ncbi:MAG TPA: hypothetical protein VFQ35_15150, partial [Polyangiaceae bacterium]|nr:hypothetical protein [Polyangiaceae bacterium]
MGARSAEARGAARFRDFATGTAEVAGTAAGATADAGGDTDPASGGAGEVTSAAAAGPTAAR